MTATRTQKCTFRNPRGFVLDARLDLPRHGEPRAFAIVSHCFTCTKETLTTFRVSRGLAQHGIGTLRFDFTGLGDSEGDFSDSNFTTMVEDVLATENWLQQHYRPATTLIGHSMGGTAALLASRQLDSCRSVVTLASPSEPAHVLHHFGGILDKLEANQEARINVAGVDYPVKPQFVHDVRSYSMASLLPGYHKPVLAVRAGQDALVGHRDADEILAYTQGDTRLLDLPSADHLFSNREDMNKIVKDLDNWVDEHINGDG